MLLGYDAFPPNFIPNSFLGRHLLNKLKISLQMSICLEKLRDCLAEGASDPVNAKGCLSWENRVELMAVAVFLCHGSLRRGNDEDREKI